MNGLPLERFQDLVRSPALKQAMWLVAGGAAVLAVLLMVRQLLRMLRRPERVSLVDSALVFDVATIPWSSDPLTASRLTVYHMPARVGLVVIAPLGRDTRRPTVTEVSALLDQIVPGLAEVVTGDQSAVRVWPRQLSGKGFAHSLARHVRLPGEHGRGSPWCLVTGRASLENEPFGIGIALRTASPNSLSLVNLESDHQWLDVLRVKSDL